MVIATTVTVVATTVTVVATTVLDVFPLGKYSDVPLRALQLQLLELVDH